ncbi:MAG: hypothetical protein GY953_37895, partial [bacterium]|nr:hypothetical protein [bacterium]
LDLYRTIDMAVKTGDWHQAKIKDLRARIRQAIGMLVKDRRLARELKKRVRKANLSMFRPQIWRIDLAGFPASRLRPGQQGWDEQLIEDLRAGEFEVIAE